MQLTKAGNWWKQMSPLPETSKYKSVYYHHIVKGFSHCIQCHLILGMNLLSKWLPHLPGANELTHWSERSDCVICFQMNVTKHTIKDKSELIKLIQKYIEI